MSKSISLGIIVPIYNEEKFLKKSVSRLLKLEIVDQIVLVDDCSSDNSYSISEELLRSSNKILLTNTLKNEGKGSAVKTGLNLITTTHVIVHDADLEYFPEDIPEMFEVSKKFPNSMILGSRFIGNKDRKNVYLRTSIANKVMSLFFSIVNFYYISDVATCYKLMPADFYKKITLKEKGFSIEIELLSKFLKLNRSIKEVPIKYEGRSYKEGKKIKASDGVNYLLNTIKYRFIN